MSISPESAKRKKCPHVDKFDYCLADGCMAWAVSFEDFKRSSEENRFIREVGTERNPPLGYVLEKRFLRKDIKTVNTGDPWWWFSPRTIEKIEDVECELWVSKDMPSIPGSCKFKER